MLTVSVETRKSLYNVLGGVQVKDNSREKSVKLFAHALVGVGPVRTRFESANCPNGSACAAFGATSSDTGFAAALGGGLDIKAGDRIQIRVIQLDDNPIRFEGRTAQ